MGTIKFLNIIFILFLLLFIFQGKSVYAQQILRTESNRVQTIVGDPINNATDILSWAQEINNSLTTGFDNGYNKLSSAITNNSGYSSGVWPSTNAGDKYWCTYEVIDSYNLSGVAGLNRSSGHGGVIYMMDFWKNNAGYKFLDYHNGSPSRILSQVQPGFAMFFQDNPGQTTIGSYDHAAIVSDININQKGDGFIKTIDSNLEGIRGVTYPVSNWDIKGTLKEVGHPNYSVMGFGTVE